MTSASLTSVLIVQYCFTVLKPIDTKINNYNNARNWSDIHNELSHRVLIYANRTDIDHISYTYLSLIADLIKRRKYNSSKVFNSNKNIINARVKSDKYLLAQGVRNTTTSTAAPLYNLPVTNRFEQALPKTIIGRNTDITLSENKPKIPVISLVGRALNLSCEFTREEAFDLFVRPIVWLKRQAKEVGIVSVVSQMWSPFKEEGRILAGRGEEKNGGVAFFLEFRVLKLMDTGEYICKLGNFISKIFFLYIKAPADSIKFIRQKSTNRKTVLHDETDFSQYFRLPKNAAPANQLDKTTKNSANDSYFETETENRSKNESETGIFVCMLCGGFPPPLVSFSLDGIELDSDSADLKIIRREINEGKLGLRSKRIYTIIILRINLTFHHHNKMLRCSSGNDEFETLSDSIVLNIQFAPKMYCLPAYWAVGSRASFLQCHVMSNPDLISPPKIGHKYSSVLEYLVMQYEKINASEYKVRVLVRIVLDFHFSNAITISVQNVVGETQINITPIRKYQQKMVQEIDARKPENSFFLTYHPDIATILSSIVIGYLIYMYFNYI